MTNLNNVDMTLNTNNPEEEMKMTNLNNDTMMVNELNKEEKMMIELNEKREMLIAAIEEELMNEVVDMVVVGDYEEILAGVEYEIIELLNDYEEQVLEEEYEMEELAKLEFYVDKITPVGKQTKEEKKMNSRMKMGSSCPATEEDLREDWMKVYLTAEEYDAQVSEGADTDGDHKAGFNKDGGVWMINEEDTKQKENMQAIETMIEEVEANAIKIEEEMLMNTTKRTFGPLAGADIDGDVKHKGIITDLTQDEVREYKAKYQESIKRELKYVDVLIGHESYHGQMKFNEIAPALAKYVEEPEGLSREQASYLLEEEGKKQDVIVSYVSRALGLSEEAITEFMNE